MTSIVRLPQHDTMHATENRLTRISLVIVWMFIFCHVWKLIPTMYEALEFFTDVSYNACYCDPVGLDTYICWEHSEFLWRALKHSEIL